MISLDWGEKEVDVAMFDETELLNVFFKLLIKVSLFNSAFLIIFEELRYVISGWESVGQIDAAAADADADADADAAAAVFANIAALITAAVLITAAALTKAAVCTADAAAEGNDDDDDDDEDNDTSTLIDFGAKKSRSVWSILIK